MRCAGIDLERVHQDGTLLIHIWAVVELAWREINKIGTKLLTRRLQVVALHLEHLLQTMAASPSRCPACDVILEVLLFTWVLGSFSFFFWGKKGEKLTRKNQKINLKRGFREIQILRKTHSRKQFSASSRGGICENCSTELSCTPSSGSKSAPGCWPRRVF